MALESFSSKSDGTATGPPTQTDEHRVFINDHGQGTFLCPVCGKGVIKDLNAYAGVESAIRLKCKCSCGHVYRVLVERRRQFRKPVSLVGMYFFQGPKGISMKGLIKILDISRSGIRFAVNSMPEFKVGDKLVVEFTLDDEAHSQIRETGIVQRIQANIIGFQFETMDHYGKLGQYLFR